MSSFTLEQYVEAFDKTPPKLKDALFADYTSAAIKTILSRHNVENVALDVSATIGYMLVGLLPVKKIIKILQEETGLDHKTARDIAYEIREQVFGPVAQELAGLQAEAQLNWQHELTNARIVEPAKATVIDESVIGEKLTSVPKQDKKQAQNTAPPPPPNLPTSQKDITLEGKHSDLRDQRF